MHPPKAYQSSNARAEEKVYTQIILQMGSTLAHGMGKMDGIVESNKHNGKQKKNSKLCVKIRDVY